MLLVCVKSVARHADYVDSSPASLASQLRTYSPGRMRPCLCDWEELSLNLFELAREFVEGKPLTFDFAPSRCT